jgi:EAL domain-containing protein (putative c-di-GMP-specific phosphodiesterase class I)/CRP-like cAMP-binding protein
LYAALEKTAPADGTWPLRQGECLRKLGKPDEALTALSRALKAFSRQHMRNKAVAVCRLMQEMDPRNPQIPGVIEWLHSQPDDEAEAQHEGVPSSTLPSLPRESGRFHVPASVRRAERARPTTERPEPAAPATPVPVVSTEAPAPAAKVLPRVVMPRTKFFSAMTEQQLRRVNERAHLLDLQPGQILYAQGDPTNALFLVATGQIAVLLPQEVGRLGRGDFFGEEVVVLPSQPRLATMRAVEASQVLALECELVVELVGETPALLEILAAGLRERLIAWLGATSPLLASLGAPEREELLARCQFSAPEKGMPVFEANDPGLVILLAGDATALLDGKMSERLRAGDVFGEIGLVTDRDIRAAVTANEKCFVLRLPRAEFSAVRAKHPAVVDYLAALAESRLRRLQQEPDQGLTSSQAIAMPPHVLVCHGDTVTLHQYEGALSLGGFLVDSADDAGTALSLASGQRFDVVVCSIDLLEKSGTDLLAEIRRQNLDVPIILTTSDPSIDTTGAAASHSVIQTLVEPVAPPELLASATRAAQCHRLTKLRRQAMDRLDTSGEWMGDRIGLEHHFRGALARLWVAFQPIVSAKAGTVVGFEALLRSHHELLRSPVAVLRAAERLRRVHEVGRIVRDQVAATAAQSAEAPILCINVHHQDLLDPHLLDPKSPLSSVASRVVLELTERVPLDEFLDLRARLAALRALGYRFALDDLGAGHAGVATLAQLEPDLAKLDMSLVRGIEDDLERQDLVRCMFDVCRDMKVQVICEGVETRQELEVLLGLGADLVQGYLFAKPGPPFPSVDPSLLLRRK